MKEKMKFVFNYTCTRVLQGGTWCYRVLHGVYIHSVTWCYIVLKGATLCYLVLDRVTWYCAMLKSATRWNMVLHGVPGCSRVLRGVTRCMWNAAVLGVCPPCLLISLVPGKPVSSAHAYHCFIIMWLCWSKRDKISRLIYIHPDLFKSIKIYLYTSRFI